MNKNDDVFDKDYAVEPLTDTSEQKEEALEEEVKVEEEKYGLSKPTRTIIRARMTSHEGETR